LVKISILIVFYSNLVTAWNQKNTHSRRSFFKTNSLGGWAHYNYKVNGVSGVLWVNFTEIIRGLQFSLLWNDSYETKGVQIGLINRSKKLKGFQIGLWNINQKRKLPLINWNFKN
jgi:hypothetical protein